MKMRESSKGAAVCAAAAKSYSERAASIFTFCQNLFTVSTRIKYNLIQIMQILHYTIVPYYIKHEIWANIGCIGPPKMPDDVKLINMEMTE